MRNKLIILFAVGAILAFAAGTAIAAGLVNSSHNMILHQGFSGAAAQKGACSFCHVPHGAGGQKLFPSALTDVATGSQWDNDPIAAICWSCHNGASAYTDAAEINPFQAGSHGRDVTELVTWGDVPNEATVTASVYGTSQDATLGLVIGCQSCHNPHDNTYRPFLRDNGGATVLASGDFLSFCEDCHQTRDDNDGGNAGADARQNHPASNVLLSETGTNANLLQYGVDTYGTDFNSTWALLSQEANTPALTGNHWNLGGKFLATTAAGAVDGRINCGTCHVVHWNEYAKGDASYGAGDGLGSGNDVTVAVNFGNNSLAVYTTDPTGTAAAVICAGCHDYASDANAGPGALTTFSHPYDKVFDGSGTTGLNVVEANGAKWGGAVNTATQRIVCQSCHDMHYARLDDTTTGTYEYALQRNYCNDCHTGTGNFKPNHHPSGITVAADTDLRSDATGAQIGANMDWSGWTDLATGRTNVMTNMITTDPAGWTASGAYYDTTGDILSCQTCHAGSSAKAHNNASSFPGVVGDATDDTMCVDCHGVNPSYFTGHNTAGLGSHYLGFIATPNYKWAQGSGTAVTPEAGAAAPVNYTADIAGDGGLLCTSCHIIKTVTGGTAQWSDNGDTDAPGTNYDDAARTNDNNDNENSTLDGVGMLLSTAGNNDNTTTPAAYLCSACHGSTPGGGSTHPVLPGYTTNMSTAVANNVNQPNNYVTHVGTNTTGTSTGQINCESCHRAHDADTDSDTYILEVAGPGDGSYIDEALLCNQCHAK